MALSTRDIKQKIASVKSTRQVTKAIEMVSAVKMRKAIEHVGRAHIFSAEAWKMLVHLAHDQDVLQHPFVAIRPIRKVKIVIMSAKRGLAGAYHGRLTKEVLSLVESCSILEQELKLHLVGHPSIKNKGPEVFQRILKLGGGPIQEVVSFVMLGQRQSSILSKEGFTVDVLMADAPDNPKFEAVRELAEHVFESYNRKEIDATLIVYTNFESALTHNIKTRLLLPISSPEQLGMLRDAGPSEKPYRATHKEAGKIPANIGYTYEPDPVSVMQSVAKQMLSAQLFQALLDAKASEHSARMIAMKNASDNAKTLVEDFTRAYNKARQASITQEIAEITSARIHME